MFLRKKKILHSCKLCGIEIRNKDVVCHRPECFQSVINEYQDFLSGNDFIFVTECSQAAKFSIDCDYKKLISDIYSSILETRDSLFAGENYRLFGITGIFLGGDYGEKIELDTRISFIHKIFTKGIVLNIPCIMPCSVSIVFYEERLQDRKEDLRSRGYPTPYGGYATLVGSNTGLGEIRLYNSFFKLNLSSHISEKDKTIDKLEKCMSKDVLLTLAIDFHDYNKDEKFLLASDGIYVKEWSLNMRFAKEDRPKSGMNLINKQIKIDCPSVDEGTC